MKNTLLKLTLCSALTIPSLAFTFPTLTTDTNICTDNNTIVSSTLLTTLLEDDLTQSTNVLEMSKNLNIITQNINTMSGVNQSYLIAMLSLSSDIGTMADSIGTMADRIVQTEVLIGDMGDRIVVVSEMIIYNNNATQLNILAAQQNINMALTQLN